MRENRPQKIIRCRVCRQEIAPPAGQRFGDPASRWRYRECRRERLHVACAAQVPALFRQMAGRQG